MSFKVLREDTFDVTKNVEIGEIEGDYVCVIKGERKIRTKRNYFATMSSGSHPHPYHQNSS